MACRCVFQALLFLAFLCFYKPSFEKYFRSKDSYGCEECNFVQICCVLNKDFVTFASGKTLSLGFSVSICQLSCSRHSSVTVRNNQIGLLSYAFIWLAYLLHTVAGNTITCCLDGCSNAYFSRCAVMLRRHYAQLSKQCKHSARVLTVISIFLCGDVHLNPGPVVLKLEVYLTSTP